MNDQLHPLQGLIDGEDWKKLGRWPRDLSVCFNPRGFQVGRHLCGSSTGCELACHAQLCMAFLELQAVEIQSSSRTVLCLHCCVNPCALVWILHNKLPQKYTVKPSFWVMFVGSVHTARYKSEPDLGVQGIYQMYDSMLLKLLGKQLLCVVFCGLHNLVQCSVCQLHVRSWSLVCSGWRRVSPWKREGKNKQQLHCCRILLYFFFLPP